MLILELNTKQVLEVEFSEQDIVETMIKTCYAFPEDYPIVEIPFAGKTLKTWFVGYKATGNRVFILKNGVCVTENLKKVKDINTIIWRLRLERD